MYFYQIKIPHNPLTHYFMTNNANFSVDSAIMFHRGRPHLTAPVKTVYESNLNEAVSYQETVNPDSESAKIGREEATEEEKEVEQEEAYDEDEDEEDENEKQERTRF